MSDDHHIGNAVTRLPVDQSGRNLSGRISSSPRHVPCDAVTMVTADTWQPRIKHLAVIGVWRPNVSTNGTRGQSNLTKSASRGGGIPRLGVTPGGRKLYH